MKPKKNKLNPQVFEDALQRVKAAFPYQGLKMGFFTHDPAGASVFGGIAKVAKSVLMKIDGSSVNIRAYREPKEPNADIHYKVDEYRGVNQPSVIKPRGSQVDDHHIKHDVPEDFMAQNNITIEVVPDRQGGLRPNVQPDGMVKAYVNFPDPIEELKHQAMERAKNRTTPDEHNP